MDKNYKIIIVLLSVAVIVLAATVTLVIFYKSVEEEVVEEVEIKEKMHVYEITWTEEYVNLTQDEIKQNWIKLPGFWDGKKLNGFFDGPFQFYLNFQIPRKFLKEVVISISWKDRFTGPLGRTGRDELVLDISTPAGGEDTIIEHVPALMGTIFEKLLGFDLSTYTCTSNLNDCPLNKLVVANTSDDALTEYWTAHDILEYNKGYNGKWEILGEVHTGEIRIIRRARNIFRNLIFNTFLGDPVNIEISYVYHTMNIVDLGEVDDDYKV